MNAIKFIKDHGVEKAREVVEGAPDGATHFVRSTYLKLIGAVWWNAWLPEWRHKDDCMVKKWKGESIDLMKTWGEVYKLEDLKQAIADYEEIAAGHRIDPNTGVTVITPSGINKVKGGITAFVDMGDDSHIENHVSPNCKKFDERVK